MEFPWLLFSSSSSYSPKATAVLTASNPFSNAPSQTRIAQHEPLTQTNCTQSPRICLASLKYRLVSGQYYAFIEAQAAIHVEGLESKCSLSLSIIRFYPSIIRPWMFCNCRSRESHLRVKNTNWFFRPEIRSCLTQIFYITEKFSLLAYSSFHGMIARYDDLLILTHISCMYVGRSISKVS